MPKINRNGVNIHFETYGNGPAIFLTHGFSDNLGIWKNQIKTLSKNNKWCEALYPGFKKSDGPPGLNHRFYRHVVKMCFKHSNHLSFHKYY